ncbi:unnamed protein product [Brassica oleracea var. botrytis]
METFTQSSCSVENLCPSGEVSKTPIRRTSFRSLSKRFKLQYRLEEEYCRTKRRVLWLKAGDNNMRYFHNKTKQRRH